MGGRVWVESAVGQGSTFWVELAWDKQASTGVQAPALLELLPRPEKPVDFSRLRVLLADDNAINRKIPLHLLKQIGLSADTITVVGNGPEAVTAAGRGDTPFDLILMDIPMPEMDGFEAAQALRERDAKNGRHTPIAAMTAHAMDGDRECCLAGGMDDCITKPLKAADLLALLTHHTRGRRAASRPEEQERQPVPEELDLSYLTNLCGGDTGFERELLQEYLQAAPVAALGAHSEKQRPHGWGDSACGPLSAAGMRRSRSR